MRSTAINFIQFGNIRHIAFDLDGVLIDSISVMRDAWAHAMQQVGLRVPFEHFKYYIGIPFKDVLSTLNIDVDFHEQIETDYNRVSIGQVDKIRMYDGVEESICRAKLAGLSLSVVTSKNRERTSRIINKLFVEDTFDVIVTPEDVLLGHGKPNPSSLLLACLRVGVNPQDTIYVGDMDSDRQCSKMAGTHFIYAGWGYGARAEVKDKWFDNIVDMMNHILD